MTDKDRASWPPQIEPSQFSIHDLHEDGNDLAYWLTRSPQERIHALEYMRHMVHGVDQANDRIQRFFEIVDLK